MSGRATSVPNNGCVAGSCLPSFPDGSFNVLIDCGGV